MTGVWWGKLRERPTKVGDVETKETNKKQFCVLFSLVGFFFFFDKIQAQLAKLRTVFLVITIAFFFWL